MSRSDRIWTTDSRNARFSRGCEARQDARIVFVAGAKQVGKTTLTAEIIADEYLALKQSVNSDPRPGRFLITGSANVLAPKRVKDALPGRMATCRCGRSRRARSKNSIDSTGDRDLRELADARRIDEVGKLLRLLATQSANLMNYRSVAQRLEMDPKTAGERLADRVPRRLAGEHRPAQGVEVAGQRRVRRRSVPREQRRERAAVDEHLSLLGAGDDPAQLPQRREMALLCGGFALEGATRTRSCSRSRRPARPRRRRSPGAVARRDVVAAQRRKRLRRPGAEEVVSRLADALLAQALRAALLELDASGTGVLALRDPQIAAAIALIGERPERAWTVGDVAAEVALSRSAFAARFRRLVGESPMRFITRARFAHAAALLHDTDAGLAEIAARAGYGTEFSFGKAFKRHFGISPGAYRGRPVARAPGLGGRLGR